MKKYQLLNKITLIALLSTLSHANSDGFYMGADFTLASFGDQSLKITNNDKSTTNYKNIDTSHGAIKVGYQHFDGNRVEIYYKNNTIDTKAGDITSETVGINYEWALSSLASETITPYILVGLGGGEATSKKIKAIDGAEVGEGSLGVGIHYQYNENLDFQLGYLVTGTGFDKFDDKNVDETSNIDQDKIILGLSYKF